VTKLQSLNLYVLRHGECEHNVARWVGSHNDSPLIHRACVTMELALEAAGLARTRYRADHRLMEIHAGDHIGINWDDIPAECHEAKLAMNGTIGGMAGRVKRMSIRASVAF
jgi:broad specificity phosphatase PhoE